MQLFCIRGRRNWGNNAAKSEKNYDPMEIDTDENSNQYHKHTKLNLKNQMNLSIKLLEIL